MRASKLIHLSLNVLWAFTSIFLLWLNFLCHFFSKFVTSMFHFDLLDSYLRGKWELWEACNSSVSCLNLREKMWLPGTAWRTARRVDEPSRKNSPFFIVCSSFLIFPWLFQKMLQFSKFCSSGVSIWIDGYWLSCVSLRSDHLACEREAIFF